MSTTDRQNRLLLAEDWKTIYQSFRYADFQSYDFDNLRRTMITYIRENYPEDFNDYIESSEYLALIDLIAFLGQNLAFRTDLNARENYIETAERRESILRLARLISYNANRNIAGNGLLKIESISTTEDVVDANNNNLSNQTIIWNDATNTDWYEQFIKILNAALPANNIFGRPVKKATVDGITTEQYRFNGNNQDVPIYSFTKSIDDASRKFEIVSTGINIENNTIFEEEPYPGNRLAFLYRDNGQGAGSSNSGFFFHFRQGTLENNTFSVANPVPNTTVNIDSDNINNTDVWLYKLDSNGNEEALWTSVNSTEGNNIVYNNVSKGITDIYSVLSRVNDRISLIFSDGTFGTLPKGDFKVYYRVSANEQYSIKPADMQGISISIPYISKNNTLETLNLILELTSIVSNADSAESNESIQTNAPSTYYTQNRLITGEDYNIGPLGVNQQIIKTKSVNRTSSGISRYYDLRDSTGKYSNTLMFGDDGSVFTEDLLGKFSFSFSSKTDIEAVINSQVLEVIKGIQTKNFYYKNFDRNTSVADLNYEWVATTNDTNQSTGILQDQFDIAIAVGTFTATALRFMTAGSLVKFKAPTGKYFDKDNTIKTGTPSALGDKEYIWTKVISIYEDGTTAEVGSTLGPIVFNDNIPSTAYLCEIIPVLNNNIVNDTLSQMVDQVFAYRTFGLRYDVETTDWKVILNSNLDKVNNFDTAKTGDVTGTNQDASWIFLFETDGETYTVTYRAVRYVFESDKQIRFYFDGNDRIYDSKTGKIVTDTIGVLSNNNKPDTLTPFQKDWQWQVVSEYRTPEGYVDSKKLEISFTDVDNDGVIDDPDLFTQIVDPDYLPDTKYIFAKKFTRSNTVTYEYVEADAEKIEVKNTEAAIGAYSAYDSDCVFYISSTNKFKSLNSTKTALVLNTNYKAYKGRDKIRFDYRHAAAENRRIDPSSSNIIDLYLLTKTYDIEYRKWLKGDITVQPLPPSSDALFLDYGQSIKAIKSISDEVIYHPVKYKPLFGAYADNDLQATIKIVKNASRVVNDNDIKSRVIDSINEFFALENWDFGETFYFSELAAYIMKQVAPDISSIVLVPKTETQSFGSLYEIKSENDEIFVSSAQVGEVEVIDSITASRLKASGKVITSDDVPNTGIQSTTTSNTTVIEGNSY
tara:strand:- start:6681 stop:10145 length:3465 start_codon:yes stop_codon:yes gene_type:complete